MPSLKISALPAATTPLAGTEIVPVVQGGTTDRATVADFLKSAVAGSAAAPSFAFSADPNTGVFSPTADTFAVATGGTERLRVDSAGNVGLGVTPSAWGSSWKVLQNQGGFIGSNTASGIRVSNNSFSDGANWIYTNTSSATAYSQLSGSHQWFNAPSGTAGTAITFTQAMTLDSGGNLGIGVTAPQAQLQVGAKLGSGGNTYSFSGYKFGVENGSTRLIGPEVTGTGQTVTVLDLLLGGSAAWSGAQALITFTGRDRGNAVDSGTLAYIGVLKPTALNASGTGVLVFGTAAAGSLTSVEGMRLDASQSLGLGTTTFGTSAAKVLSIGSGTEPSSGPADTVQFFSVDRSAGNTIPGIRCEGTGVTDAAITNVTVTNKIAIKVNGTVYYLLATTSAA
jgi:hypothetical protein